MSALQFPPLSEIVCRMSCCSNTVYCMLLVLTSAVQLSSQSGVTNAPVAELVTQICGVSVYEEFVMQQKHNRLTSFNP